MKIARSPNPQTHRRKRRKVSLREILIVSIETLWNNKLRTALTMLGVIIGISSVIMITSIGQGVQKQTGAQISALGTNVMVVQAGAARRGGVSLGAGSASTLTWEDARAIAKQVPDAKAVTAFLQRGSIQVVRGNINIATTLLGTDLNYPSIKNIQPQEGLFFSQADLDAGRPVAFIGSKIRDELFSTDKSTIGADLRIQGKRYTVVGVAESKGLSGGQDLGGVIGVGLGVALAFGVATIFKFPFVVPLWSIVTGFVLSLLVGVLAGGIPARNAAKLNPISALRSD